MDFDALLHGVNVLRRAGPNASVRGVEYDSRQAGRDSLFVALEGETTDGNRYIDQAAAQGIVALVTGSASAFDAARLRYPTLSIAQIAPGAPHGRRALALIAANFFRHPELRLKICGVTGTNGKTTTACLLESMLRRQGRTTILIGTIAYRVAGQLKESPHTTPEPRDLFEIFREGVDAGASEAVMEVSSHALDQERVFGLHFDVAVFTNLTQDHLDYHGAMESYFAAKRKLFEGLDGTPPRVAILNHDDEYGLRIRDAASAFGVESIWTYGIEDGDFRAEDLTMDFHGSRFRMVTPQGSVKLDTALAGRVNVYNLLAASAAALSRGMTLHEIAESAAVLKNIPGRFENVLPGHPFSVIVDYAHTDDALRNVLAAARDFVSAAHGRVITLFGCGGDRDRAKRPLMGRAAGSASEVVVLTSDNPRSEDPRAILDDVLAGLKGTSAKVVVEPDRRRAIEIAIGEAEAGDLVLLAGKGHEKTQVLRDRVIPFDDAEIAREIVERFAAGQG